MYSMGACAVLGMTNQDALSEDLESDLFPNSALQRFTFELYYRFGSFLAPKVLDSLLAGINYPNMVLKMEEQVEKTNLTNKKVNNSE